MAATKRGSRWNSGRGHESLSPSLFSTCYLVSSLQMTHSQGARWMPAFQLEGTVVSGCGDRNSPNPGSPLPPPAQDSQCHSWRSRCLTLSRKLIGRRVQWHPSLQSAPCRFSPEGHLGMRLTQNLLTTEQASHHCAGPAVILRSRLRPRAQP